MRGFRRHEVRSRRSIPLAHGRRCCETNTRIENYETVADVTCIIISVFLRSSYEVTGSSKDRGRESKVPREPHDLRICRRQDRFAHRARDTLHLGPDIRSRRWPSVYEVSENAGTNRRRDSLRDRKNLCSLQRAQIQNHIGDHYPQKIPWSHTSSVRGSVKMH